MGSLFSVHHPLGVFAQYLLALRTDADAVEIPAALVEILTYLLFGEAVDAELVVYGTMQ